MFAIVYRLVRLVMVESADCLGVAPECISFKGALRWVRVARNGGQFARIRKTQERTGRIEPRVLKRRPRKFSVMKKPIPFDPSAIFRERRYVGHPLRIRSHSLKLTVKDVWSGFLGGIGSGCRRTELSGNRAFLAHFPYRTLS